MTIPERLQALREWMQNKGIQAFIIPSNDPHFSEYVAPHWGCRAWISGFDGSAGTVVVTPESAALWTDSRYFLQAEMQLRGTGIGLQRMGLAGTPSMTEWLIEQKPKQVGVDGRLFSKNSFELLRSELQIAGIELVAVGDPFSAIWPDRPVLPRAETLLLDTIYSGETAKDKLQRIRKLQGGDEVRIIAVLDEIAWTLNIRGGDIEYNPVVISYLAIEPEKTILFVDPSKFTSADRVRLADESGVELRPYAAFAEYLAWLGNRIVVVNPNTLDYFHYSLLLDNQAIIREEHTPSGLISGMKAIKNPTEQVGFRQAMETDGVALVRFEMWLEKAIRAGQRPTELEIASKLHEYRAVGKRFQGESFETIAGYASHGAIVHYGATRDSDIPVGTDNFLLIDSGAQYLYGTTDITRTYHFGTPTTEQKRDYTAVLKGMVDLSAVRFPAGTRGTQLDVLARRYLWNMGVNYLHGTGHGIGHFLCVHEGPQSIRMNENPVTLEPGMVQSCEPGLYLAGKYGIRIENLTLVTENGCPEGFQRFETLTLCPISLTALNINELELPQREWLNDYHSTVYERLAPYLEPDEQEWLRNKTQPV